MLNGFVVHYQPLALGEEFAKKIYAQAEKVLLLDLLTVDIFRMSQGGS